MGARRGARPARRISIALVGNAAEIEPALGRRRRAVRRRHRPDLRARRARRLRAGRDRARRRARRCATRSPTSTSARSMALDGRPRPGDARVPGAPARSSSTTATTCARRRRRPASRTPSTTRASCRPSSGRCSARARARSAGPRCRATRPTSCAPTEAVLELFPDDAGLRRWIELAEERVPFQGLPARICWLGYGERARAGLRVQRARRVGRGLGADRDRARPPRRGLGRLAEPRDGGACATARDAIADWPLLNALRQHRRRRDLGVDPPRRRRRHRLHPARRHGRRRRRHAARRRRSSSGC